MTLTECICTEGIENGLGFHDIKWDPLYSLIILFIVYTCGLVLFDRTEFYPNLCSEVRS